MEILKTPGFHNIFQLECFDREFRALFGKGKSDLKRYEKWLTRRLRILDANGKQATDGTHFEKIDTDVYSIRLPESKHNPRILYSFIINDNTVILICAFLENNSSDYEKFKKKALYRINLIKEEYG